MPAVVDLHTGQRAIELAFTPSPKARDFILDTRFITGYFGPFGCGKTTCLVHKAWLYGQAFPGAKVGLFRNTWPNLRDTTMATFFEWFPPGIAGHYHKTDKIFEMYLPDNQRSFIYFRHMDSDQDISNCLSLELAAAAFDEPQGGLNSTGGIDPGISVNLYRALQGRVGRQKGDYHPMLWMTGNPPPPDHWVANEFGYDGQGEPRNPYHDRHLYLGEQQDNEQNLTPGYYKRLERSWGVNTPMARRFLKGWWISFGVEKPFHKSWIRHWGLDDEPGLPPARYTDAEGLSRTGRQVEAAFDPAISKNDAAARSALVVGMQSRHPDTMGRIFIVEAQADHWSLWEQVDHILKAVVRWKVRVLRVEKVAYQSALKPLLEREARSRGISLYVDLMPPEEDKIRRANAWSGFVEDGTVLFPPGWAPVITDHGEEYPEDADLISCMLAVPGDKSKWDPVDACGQLIKGFNPLAAASQRIPGTEETSPDLAESYAAPQVARPRETGASRVFRPRVQSGMDRAKGYAGRRPGAPEPRRKGWR